MQEQIKFEVRNELQLDNFSYPLYRLIKDLNQNLDNVNEVFDGFLYDFQDIVLSRNLVPGLWTNRYETVEAIREKVKEINEAMLLPVANEEYLISQLGQEQDSVLTICALSTLLLFNPYQEANLYDVSAWNLHGTIETQSVQEIGTLLLELACHAHLSRGLTKVRAFEYYAITLEALKNALTTSTWSGNESLINWSVFSLVALALKFRENISLIYQYPYLSEYISTIATQIIGFSSDITESALSDIFVQAINQVPNVTLTISNLLNVNFMLLNNVMQGNVSPMIPEVENADYLIDDEGKVYKKEDFAAVDHEHNEYLRINQPAQNANFLIDSSGKLYTASNFAREGHTHSEYVDKEDIKDADFLWSTDKLYTADDFAERNHLHDGYLSIGQPARAARAFLAELLSGRRLSPIIHEHPELLKPSDVADSTYRLGGKKGSEFANVGHEHPQYITNSQAQALGELTNVPPDPKKGAKGVYAVFDEPGTTKDELKAVHFIFGQITFNGTSNIIYVPNVVFAHCTLVAPNTQTAMPVVNYVYDQENPERVIGVQFISPTNGLTQIMYMIAYQPDVTEWLNRNLLSSGAQYDVN